MQVGDLMSLARELDPDGNITEKDMEKYIGVVLEALGIHVEREAIRHGLWKNYPASDQNYQVKVKADRIARSLEAGTATQAQIDNAVEEFLDIINYCIFGVRKLRGSD